MKIKNVQKQMLNLYKVFFSKVVPALKSIDIIQATAIIRSIAVVHISKRSQLGPLMLIIFFNDIKRKLLLYTDDSKIF